MRRIVASAFVSLDGVMQAPCGRTEDPTGGFVQGGWLFKVGDPGIGETLGAIFGQPFDLLLGRRTYDIFAAYWPFVTGEEAGLGHAFTACAKHVLTRGDQPLDWANSHRLGGIDAVAALKQGDGPDLLIQGSSTLYPTLLAAGLIDRLTLFVSPVLLGRGKRLFGHGTAAGLLRLDDHRVTDRGTVIATYAPAGALPDATDGPEPATSAAEGERQQRMAEGRW